MFSRLARRLAVTAAFLAWFAPAFAQAPAPVPALPDAERRTSYVLSASVCTCSVGMQLYGDSTDVANWLKVYINGVEIPQSGNWTITSPSGPLANLARPITNAVLTFTGPQTGTVQIVGAQRPRRLSEYAENRGVAARDLNQATNGIEAQLREMWDRQFRTVQAPPGETLSVLPPQSGRANMGACFDSSGNLAPCLAAGSGTFVAGSGINFTGTGPTTISTATYAAGNGITFNGSNPTTISVSSTSGTPLIPTRAVAATLDLSAYGVIMTGGYATPGDGGHAVFKNVGSAAFIDSFISTFSIQGGSGCTNGTYGAPSGSITTTAVTWFKSGNPSIAVGTATVAGNVVTAVNITNTPGNGFSVGDVLSPASPLTGCSVQPTITVTAMTAPRASFTDAVGNHFQFVPSSFPNVLNFGAKGDWNGSDGAATDNFAAVQAAVNFAGYKSSTSFDSGGWWGGRVIVPSGSYMMCGTTSFILPEGTVLQGASEPGTSQLHLCDAFNINLNAFTICDPIWGFACLGAKYENISFHASRSVAVTGGIFMIYSNNLQDFGGLYKVYVYGGQRGCFHFEKGYGGTSWAGAEKVSCNISSPNNPMARIGNTAASGMNFGSAIISLRDIVLGGPSSAPFHLQAGMQIFGAFTNAENVHCENINQQCIYIESPASANGEIIRLTNINSQGCTSGGTCNGVVTLGATNNPGNTIFSMIIGSTYAHVIENGQPGGSHFNSSVKLPIICDTTCHN
jgi:hypothetical protein